jgi:ribosomal protein L30E
MPFFASRHIYSSLGYKSTMKALRQGKAKLIIIASNTPVTSLIFYLFRF